MSLVSEPLQLDALFLFSEYQGLEASLCSVDPYSSFHPNIPSNAFICYHSDMILLLVLIPGNKRWQSE